MAKAPQAGSVKTRLVPPLTPEEAARLHVCFLRDLTGKIAELSADERVHGVIAYTPAELASALDGLLPEGFRLLAQRGNNLTERLIQVTRDLFRAGFQSICLMNADSPTLPRTMIERAFAALRASGDRVVLGPAEDGGYYLIGLKRPHVRLFEGIPWSTAQVFDQTLTRAREMKLEAKTLPPWYDVDDPPSLRRLYEELFNSIPTTDSAGAPQTREYLSSLMDAGAGARLGFKFPAASEGRRPFRD